MDGALMRRYAVDITDRNSAMHDAFHWINEPPLWSGDEKALELRTGADTDFWRETFYGFIRDRGHAFIRPVSGDFTAAAVVTGDYEALYDQAGLYLRADERHWIKAGIEYTDGMMHFSVVVTNDVSDWSVIPLPEAKPSDEIKVRLTRHGDAVRVQFAVGDAPWQMARLCPFQTGDAEIGVMACSPQREGFRANFRELTVGPPISRELHAD
jgi:regulation of enolase protein 1 (concanavalin A-like superfamily)